MERKSANTRSELYSRAKLSILLLGRNETYFIPFPIMSFCFSSLIVRTRQTEYKTGLSERVKISSGGDKIQSRGTNGTRAGITNLFDNSILDRVIFDFPDIIALCHATPDIAASSAIRFRPITPLVYLLRILPSVVPQQRAPIPYLLGSFRSLFTRQRLVFQPLYTRPIRTASGDVSIHGDRGPVSRRFFSNSFLFLSLSRLAHLCLALIDPKWLFLEGNRGLFLSLVALHGLD